MYTQFFRLSHTPFSIAPDPRYVYMSERHREALAHLLYGIDGGGGFVLLTGEIGAGKTTICRCFLEQVPASCNVAYIFNPKLTVIELLRTICEEFHIDAGQSGNDADSAKSHVDALNRFLLASHAAGRNNVLIIDEAQNLSADVLEQLRLLTNLETSERKLLQIILIGQPELRAMLARPELEQLAQRVIARYHLGALTEAETAGYIAHRLSVAGLATASPFPPRVARAIHRATHGVPRRINLLCDRALLGAYVENRQEVDRRIVMRASREVFGEATSTRKNGGRWNYAIAGLLVAGGAAAAIAWNMHGAVPAGNAATERESRTAAVASAPVNPARAVAAIPVATRERAVTAQPVPTIAAPGAFDSHDYNAALRQLAALWNASLDGTSPACDAGQAGDLHCYTSSGGFAELRQLDRPAVLTLRDESGQPYFAILTALDSAEASLQIGGESRKLGIVALARQFDGAFTTFWRAPHDYRARLTVGEHGEEVDWIAQQLARLNGEPGPETGKTFDQEMARKVREFQFAQGLKVDGLIGPRTIMQLNRASGVAEPRLQAIAVAAGSADTKSKRK